MAVASQRRRDGAPVVRRNRDTAVIQAAISVMSQRGYSATTVQDIADRVGVLKGSLYHYFASKEDLLFRVLDESHAESDRIAAEVAALGLDPLEELCEFLRALSLWYLAHRERANIYFTELRHLTGDRLKLMQQRRRRFGDHISDLISAAKEKGQIESEIDPMLLTRYVLGSLNNIRAWPTRTGTRFTDPQMADAFVELTRQALRAR